MDIRPIDTAPTDIESTDAGIQFGPWVTLHGSEMVPTRGRWRLPLTRYDISRDCLVRREGAWWGEFGALDVQPSGWSELA